MEFPDKRDTGSVDQQANFIRPSLRLLGSRRWTISMFAIACLAALGIHNNLDTSMSIATVAVGLSAANSFQKKNTP